MVREENRDGTVFFKSGKPGNLSDMQEGTDETDKTGSNRRLHDARKEPCREESSHLLIDEEPERKGIIGSALIADLIHYCRPKGTVMNCEIEAR